MNARTSTIESFQDETHLRNTISELFNINENSFSRALYLQLYASDTCKIILVYPAFALAQTFHQLVHMIASLHSTPRTLRATSVSGEIWAALDSEVLRADMVIEVSMEQRRNERAGKTGDPPRKKKPGLPAALSGTIRTRGNLGVAPVVDGTRLTWEGASRLTAQPPRPHTHLFRALRLMAMEHSMRETSLSLIAPALLYLRRLILVHIVARAACAVDYLRLAVDIRAVVVTFDPHLVRSSRLIGLQQQRLEKFGKFWAIGVSQRSSELFMLGHSDPPVAILSVMLDVALCSILWYANRGKGGVASGAMEMSGCHPWRRLAEDAGRSSAAWGSLWPPPQSIAVCTCVPPAPATLLLCLHCPSSSASKHVSEMLACSPLTEAIQVQNPGQVTPDFCIWEPCRTMPLVGGSSRGSPISPTLSFRRCFILTSNTLIGTQHLDVKSRPIIFTLQFSRNNKEFNMTHGVTINASAFTRRKAHVKMVHDDTYVLNLMRLYLVQDGTLIVNIMRAYICRLALTQTAVMNARVPSRRGEGAYLAADEDAGRSCGAGGRGQEQGVLLKVVVVEGLVHVFSRRLSDNHGTQHSSRLDKIDAQHVYTEVTFAIRSYFIRHALDDSEPIADLQGNNVRNGNTARLARRSDECTRRACYCRPYRSLASRTLDAGVHPTVDGGMQVVLLQEGSARRSCGMQLTRVGAVQVRARIGGSRDVAVAAVRRHRTLRHHGHAVHVRSPGLPQARPVDGQLLSGHTVPNAFSTQPDARTSNYKMDDCFELAQPTMKGKIYLINHKINPFTALAKEELVHASPGSTSNIMAAVVPIPAAGGTERCDRPPLVAGVRSSSAQKVGALFKRPLE
ncbi:hypothetical protein PR048_026977 [Dryococelus australis]|uniref:Uncharacterized protein n=1 Tax=Dryococelus australis TaxID=614101 RepID=A0ABQ9GMV7_9NEOP|nr:hypothetical protein PR048_026977 [Dryococelus australis]